MNSTFEVDRRLQPKTFGTVSTAEVHTFADAIQDGRCSYLRFCALNDTCHCSFLYGKSRVIPSSKKLTISRLELFGALLAARVGSKMKLELDFDIQQIYYTDSKTELGYIFNSTKRFHMFVANRVAQIRELTKVAAWSHVGGDINPASIAFHEMEAHQLLKSIRLTGFSFLYQE